MYLRRERSICRLILLPWVNQTDTNSRRLGDFLTPRSLSARARDRHNRFYADYRALDFSRASKQNGRHKSFSILSKCITFGRARFFDLEETLESAFCSTILLARVFLRAFTFCLALAPPSDQLFGTRNERNSIRNIEVNVPSREVSKATGMYSSRLRKEGRKEGTRERLPGRRWRRRGEAAPRRWRMHSNGFRDKEQDQCDSQLSPGLRTRFSYVVLALPTRGASYAVATFKRG